MNIQRHNPAYRPAHVKNMNYKRFIIGEKL